MFQHMDPSQCPILAVAMDLFSYFHLRSGPVPDCTKTEWCVIGTVCEFTDVYDLEWCVVCDVNTVVCDVHDALFLCGVVCMVH